MKNEIFDYVRSIQEEIIGYRRHLHENPELSFQEYQTRDFIFEKLKSFGLEPKIIGETGVTALVINNQQSENEPCIGLRADMDALPIEEQAKVPFKSKNSGVMHACGHDVHTSILLGVAKVLSKYKHLLKQPIKLISQPGEEKLPGGASVLIKAGILDHPKVEKIYGLHVSPELKVGQIGYRSGIYMASCDEIYIDIHGKGGHGALPQNCVDPIVIGASLVMDLQQIISRKGDPRIPSVLTFGHFEALGATNVIPNEAKLKGTFRTFNEEWRAKAHQWIEKSTQAIVESAGGKVDIRIEKGYPFLKNDALLTSQFVTTMQENTEITLVPLEIRMTSEDFSYYTQEVPAVFFRLGTSDEKNQTQYSVHNSNFLVNEECIYHGINTFIFNTLNIK